MNENFGRIAFWYKIVWTKSIADLVIDEPVNESEKEILRISQDISAKVKKCWKLLYIECSSKHNWNVNIVFRELARDILAARCGMNGIHRNKGKD